MRNVRILLVALLTLAGAWFAFAQTESRAPAVVLEVDGPIGPATGGKLR